MSTLDFRGPPTPDLFRRQVGRFGERHYVDPLPADDTWPALDEDQDPWPSVTTVKKAWPFYAAKKWAAETVAEWAYDNVSAWSQLDRQTAVKALADQADHSLNRAGKRGTEVHEIIDLLSTGRELGYIDPAAAIYIDTCRLIVDELKPRWLATETVVLSRSLGYGGTFDAVGLVEIDGLGVCIVDWKSRKPGKNGAYAEEAAQIAAYASADYMIVAGPDGNAVRQPLPEITHGLIVSIDPSGYEAYAVDMEHAEESWIALRAFWQAQRKTPTKLVRSSTVATIVAGGEQVPDSSPVEPAPPGDVDPAPFEGGPADPAAVLELRERFDALTPEATEWMKTVISDANRVGRKLGLQHQPTQRKYWIGLGLIELAERQPDNALLAAAIHVGVGHELPPTGEHLSTLTCEQAARFAFAAENLAKGGALLLETDGTASIQAA